jgi:MFS family permease
MSGWNDRGLIILGLVISLEMLISMELLLPIYIKNTTGSIFLIGSLYSINGLVGLLIRIPSGAFSDRLGRKPFI